MVEGRSGSLQSMCASSYASLRLLIKAELHEIWTFRDSDFTV